MKPNSSTRTASAAALLTIWVAPLFAQSPAKDQDAWTLKGAAQGAMLSVAGYLPRAQLLDVTRLALRVDGETPTHDRVLRAAGLLSRNGEPERAAWLHRGLARMDFDAGRGTRAHEHLAYASKISPSADDYVSLAILDWENKPKRASWLAKLGEKHPGHELAEATACAGRLWELSWGLPRSCETIEWVRQQSQAAQGDYARLEAEIQGLPSVVAENIRNSEEAMASLRSEQFYLTVRRNELDAKITNLTNSGTAEALIQAGIDILPLPQKGDDLATFILREGFCSLPVIRGACAVANVANRLAEVDRQLKQSGQERDSVVEQLQRKEAAIADQQRNVAYWRSPEPLNKLTRARDRIVPDLRAGLERQAFEKFQTIGQPISTAVARATAP